MNVGLRVVLVTALVLLASAALATAGAGATPAVSGGGDPGAARAQEGAAPASTSAAPPASSPAPTPSPTAAPDAPPAASRAVAVTYFHTTARCATCRKIEALSEEAIRTGFSQELKDGKVLWKVVNTDEPDNRHFLEDYQLYTKSLVVVETAGGRQLRWKNLARIWQLVRDDAAFRQYVQDEVRGYLEGRP